MPLEPELKASEGPARRDLVRLSRRAARQPAVHLAPTDKPLSKRVHEWVRHVAEGKTDEQAAELVGLRLKRARLLLLDSRVRSLLAVQLEVLRARERPRNLHTLVSIRDDDALKGTAAGAKARIDAVKALERMADDDEASTHAGARAGGYRVDLSEPAVEGVRVTVDYVRIGGKPNDINDHVPSAPRNAGLVIEGEAIDAQTDAPGDGHRSRPERG